MSPGMFLPGASSLHCGRLGPKTRSGESGAFSSSSSIGYRSGTRPIAITAEPENASTIGTPANHGAAAADAAAAADDDDDDDDDGDGVVVRNGSPADCNGDSESESLADDAIATKDWACQSSVPVGSPVRTYVRPPVRACARDWRGKNDFARGQWMRAPRAPCE